MNVVIDCEAPNAFYRAEEEGNSAEEEKWLMTSEVV
jgi:hypothetical protein